MNLEGLTTDQLEQELIEIESARTRLAALQLALIAEADRRQVPLADGCRTTADWVAARLDIPADQARSLTNLALRLGDLPATSRRLAEGECGVARAELISRVADPGSESDWWQRLLSHGLSGTERIVRRHGRLSRRQERRLHADSYFSIQPSLDESWWNITGGLAGVAGQLVSDAIRQKADAFPRDEGSLHHRQALALETLCAGEDPPAPRLTAFFDLDAATARPGAGAELAWGPRIGQEAVAEILCGGTVKLVGLSGRRPVVASRNSSKVPPAVRDFVKWRDGGCRVPGCESRHRLQVHHIAPRSHGGTHHPDNLVTLCWYHHHVVVHRRGFVIEKRADGRIRLVLPADSRAPP